MESTTTTTEKHPTLDELLDRHPRHDSFAAQNFRDLLALFKGEQSYRRIENSCYMPLVLEWLSPTEVSMCHYGTQNGDAMRDPEVVFGLSNFGKLGIAEPFFFRNDYLHLEHYTCVKPKWVEESINYKPHCHRGLCAFVRDWFGNLRDQGFFEI